MFNVFMYLHGYFRRTALRRMHATYEYCMTGGNDATGQVAKPDCHTPHVQTTMMTVSLPIQNRADKWTGEGTSKSLFLWDNINKS